MTIEMKPCPLCGCDDLEGSPFPAGRTGEWVARCGHPLCGVEISGPSPEETARRWNRRAPEQQTALPKWQVYVQRNLIGLDGGLTWPQNCEQVPWGPLFDTRDSALLYGSKQRWMDIWWSVRNPEKSEP